jgi:segregation and condensation protein A
MGLIKTNPYEVRLPDFEGPLDLLLRLVEKNELPIDRVSLALVTDQYLEHLEQLQALDPRDLAEFLVVASKLLLIKSQALLPRPPALEAEEDGTDDLVQQLIAYRRVKEVAGQLSLWQVEGRRSYPRLVPLPFTSPPTVIEGLELDDLVRAVQNRLQQLASSPASEHFTRAKRSVADRVRDIETLLAAGSALNFGQLITAAVSKPEVIVTFMAVLELIRRGRVAVQQEAIFGEIILERLEA